ncbi:MAG: hypothetical protein JXR37_31180 [Kiritimatiellae bacterium]|nr:hypothetical protein [Kiritimatiellia bacterium]
MFPDVEIGIDEGSPLPQIDPLLPYPIVYNPVEMPGPPETQGADWDWGTWARQEIWLQDGVEVPHMFHGTYVQPHGAPDLSSVINGAVGYDLQGQGIAAAYLEQAGALRYMQGTCAVNVRVGGGLPHWDGTVLLTGSSADVQFEASGTVSADGRLQGAGGDVLLLNCRVDGQSFHDAGFQKNIAGRLVGSGQLPAPISGAIGWYELEPTSGSGPVLQGIFGANLSPR